jgi:opacity protein-like surface antigen
MKIKLLVAAAATVVASSAMAQSAFEGFYGQISTGYESTNIGSSGFTANTGTPFPVNAPSQNTSTMPLMLGLGYNFSVTPQFLLGLGADYQAISSTSSTATFTVPGGCGGPCPGTQYKASNQYSIFVTPGYAIDKDKLAYLKAGYASQNLKATFQGTGGDPDGGSSFGSSTVSGYVVGLGYKQIITGGIYGFAEGNYYSYGKASFNNTLQPSGTTISGYGPSSSAYNFLVGVGYRF